MHFLNCIYSYDMCIITVGDKASQEGFDIKRDETLAVKKPLLFFTILFQHKNSIFQNNTS